MNGLPARQIATLVPVFNMRQPAASNHGVGDRRRRAEDADLADAAVDRAHASRPNASLSLSLAASNFLRRVAENFSCRRD